MFSEVYENLFSASGFSDFIQCYQSLSYLLFLNKKGEKSISPKICLIDIGEASYFQPFSFLISRSNLDIFPRLFFNPLFSELMHQ